MAKNKTVATNASVADFLASLDDQQRNDSKTLIKIMSDVSGEPPVMWGVIVGFGSVHLKYESGRELDWMRIGFSPRKGKLSLYITYDAEKFKPKLDQIGKYKTGKGCIYINKLDDVDVDKLAEIIRTAYDNSGGISA